MPETTSSLGPGDLEQYRKHGHVVVRQLFAPDQLRAWRDHIDAWLAGEVGYDPDDMPSRKRRQNRPWTAPVSVSTSMRR